MSVLLSRRKVWTQFYEMLVWNDCTRKRHRTVLRATWSLVNLCKDSTECLLKGCPGVAVILDTMSFACKYEHLHSMPCLKYSDCNIISQILSQILSQIPVTWKFRFAQNKVIYSGKSISMSCLRNLLAHSTLQFVFSEDVFYRICFSSVV